MKIKALFMSTLLAGSAFAQGTFGVHGGVGLPMGDGADALKMGIGFGASGEFMVNPSFGLGAFVTYQMVAFETEIDGLSASQMPFGVTANFHADGFYAGINGGMANFKVTFDGVSESESDIFVGAQAGYDFPVADSVTVGIEARYLHILAEGGSSGLLNGLGQVKFQF